MDGCATFSRARLKPYGGGYVSRYNGTCQLPVCNIKKSQLLLKRDIDPAVDHRHLRE